MKKAYLSLFIALLITSSLVIYNQSYKTYYDPSYPLISHTLQKEDTSISMLLGGDFSYGENYLQELNWKGSKFDSVKEYCYEYSIANFKNLLGEADYNVINLETPITNKKKSDLEGIKNYLHWTDIDKTPKALKNNLIGIVSLANNHTKDYETEGLRQTLDILNEYEIYHIGAGKNAYEAQQALKVEYNKGSKSVILVSGFHYTLNYDFIFDFYANEIEDGVNSWKIHQAKNQIKMLRDSFPESFIIAYPHWGKNYEQRTSDQQQLAHGIIDAGADMIIGHGSHTMQGIEQYNDKLIIYGLGNFVFNSLGRYGKLNVKPYSLIAKADIDHDHINLKLYPIFSDNRITFFQPRFLTKKETNEAFQILIENSTKLSSQNITLEQDQHGYYFKIKPIVK